MTLHYNRKTIGLILGVVGWIGLIGWIAWIFWPTPASSLCSQSSVTNLRNSDRAIATVVRDVADMKAVKCSRPISSGALTPGREYYDALAIEGPMRSVFEGSYIDDCLRPISQQALAKQGEKDSLMVSMLDHGTDRTSSLTREYVATGSSCPVDATNVLLVAEATTLSGQVSTLLLVVDLGAD